MTNSTRAQNRLASETSPYLLQHAHNPVDWYPWGEEAFERARQENKPVFLSIGYSTCHWCHVMAHESFEDMEVAKALNAGFISVKVDREERPDVDYVYMQACQAITGAGGWPLSIFLTPDKEPFYAGMYFPKRRAYGRIGFLELLGVISEKWQQERDTVLHSAGGIAKFLSQQDTKSTARSDREDIVRKNYTALCNAFDAQYGGFGDAPKFPTPQHLRFLLKYYALYQEQHAYEMTEKTLKSMYRGGIFDHIGYGFSRYSTDQYWLVPHFEKMLYDNALLAAAALAAYEQKGDAFFLELARKIFLYLFKELKSGEGGFYAAQDADSEGEEGKYYLLSYDELIETLGEEAGRAFAAHYHILPGAKEEAERIPNLLHNDTLAPGAQNDIRKLYDYRRTRYALHLDDKILAAQNGMVLSALSDMHRLTGEDMYLHAAERCAIYIQENLMRGERLYTSRCRGKLSEYGYLDDYAHCALGFLSLYNATLCEAHILQAHALVKTAVELHFDPAQGGFYLSAHDGEALFMRPKEVYDGATPSGNATITEALFLLVYLGFEDLRPVLEKQLAFMDGACTTAQAHSQYFYVRMLYEAPQKKIVCVLAPGAHCKRTDFELRALVRVYTTPTEEYKLLNEKTTYYICENGACSVLRNE